MKEETTTASENLGAETEGKNIAIIAYITLIGLIIAFIMNIHKHLRRKRSTIWDI